MSSWVDGVITILQTISEILTAGIAITAFALLLYSLTFNLRDKVAQTFSGIMFCLVIIFSAESFGGTSVKPEMIDLWLRVQWVGIILLPATYLHFSDALLATTGLPSRWRRKWAVRLVYAFSLVLFAFLFTPWFLGDLVINNAPAPHHQPTLLTELFTLYYLFLLALAGVNFVRAYKRTVTKTSKRRMLYLTLSSIGPALGSFPFLLYGSEFAARQPFLFWIMAIAVSVVLGGMIFVMAYSVAFFGVPWPDRVVKSRLLKWTLRGPVTASLVLALTTLVRRGGEVFGNPYSAFVPIVMVITILILEYAITLFFPYLEKWLFFSKEERDVSLMRSLEERIITRSDLKQFIEMVLAAVSDRLQSTGSYLIAETDDGLDVVDRTDEVHLDETRINELERYLEDSEIKEDYFVWNSDILFLLRNSEHNNHEEILGFLGVCGISDQFPLAAEEMEYLRRMISRATLALKDREMLEQVFDTLERMNPQEELIQQLRAAGRFDKQALLLDSDRMERKEMTQWVKGALTHYWGGPKLTQSPLMKLKIVQSALEEHEGNPANALRSVLKTAIEQIRPEGERRYTNEWILYNILDLKFMEGKKVREIALKLSVSEADLYRKQRVAIEAIADKLVQMEMMSTESITD
mgnify:CR=1 FL=1